MHDVFSPDYSTARTRFREAAAALGMRTEALSIDQKGPDGADLTVDVAVLGAEAPRRAVVVSSGLHGVEGFFGSAAQLALMRGPLADLALPDDAAVVLLHALNPYGFAWIRRVNEDNADLNRSFLREGERYEGAPDGYGSMDGLLNPTRPPSSLDRLTFLPRAAFRIARVGLPTLKNAVGGGQYDFPRGLFYGGPAASRTQLLLDEHLPRWVGSCERVLHVDFHTGLGPSATYKLFVDHGPGDPETVALAAIFGPDVVEPWHAGGTSYTIRGGLGTWCKARFPDIAYDVLAAEFGTRHLLRIIAALREENCAHHWAAADPDATSAAKRRLQNAFAPAEPAWRQAVVPKAVDVVRRAFDEVFA